MAKKYDKFVEEIESLKRIIKEKDKRIAEISKEKEYKKPIVKRFKFNKKRSKIISGW